MIIKIALFPLLLLFFFLTRDGFDKNFYLAVIFSHAITFFNLPYYKYIIAFLLIINIWLFYPFRLPNGLSLFFGVPGSGKTTLAAYLIKHSSDPNIYSNVPIKGALQIDRNDIGKYDISNGMLIIDEAGIDFNNRFGNTRKSNLALNEDQIRWLKLYRHYKIKKFACLSQRVDMDITIRGLADRVYLLRKIKFPYIVIFQGVKKILTVDIPPNSTVGQITDGYKIKIFDIHFIFSPPLWKLFDTYDAPPMPQKEFQMWNSTTKYLTDNEQSSLPE